MTLQPKCEDVETAEGVAITVTGVAQVNHHTFPGNASSDSSTNPQPHPPSTPSYPPPFSLASTHIHSRGGISYRGLK